ncbi:NAD(P)/FAD-dependent oxidoreductase [Sorangium sp. So ce117]|uniref:NAD(P)/FAD-dependent oxidoreductase n=1 Tax=Sorangium sp. So ce117 TaxID=3133277 RepID=UPI003F6474DF
MNDAVVVGGGLAGAAVALLLSQAGREVTLIEREASPADKVCGEFLSREAALYLASFGLDLRALGAVPIEAVRLVERDRVAAAALPFPALSLSRRVLDEALLARAAAAGASIRRGVRVQALTRAGAGWGARLEDGSALEARAAFLATGKHDVRGLRRPSGLQDDLVAFKLHWRLSPRQAAELDRHVELVLFEGGYAGLQPVEGGRANLCLLVRKSRFAALGQRWDRLLCAMREGSPHLDARLAGAEPCRERPLALSAIPYGHVQRRADGIWRLGDQAAVIPSFSGDGMSIALHSARLATTAYLEGASAEAFQRRLSRDVLGQVLLATGLSHCLVRRPAQAALGAAARLCPGLMAAVAGRTRVSEAALVRGGLPVAALQGGLGPLCATR